MKRIRRLSVSVFLIILALLIVPFAAVLWYVRADMEGMLRDEISLKVVQNLQKSEVGINQLIGRMATISNVFYWDDALTEAFTDPARSYYERYTAFNRVIRNIAMQNLYEYADVTEDSGEKIKITFFDQSGRIYSSWSRNYQDYSYLARQDLVVESRSANGFMRWSMNALGYEPGGAEAKRDQIALARVVALDSLMGRAIGTLLISVDQRQVAGILDGYKYSADDLVFAASGEKGLLFSDAEGVEQAFFERQIRRFSDLGDGNAVVELNGRKYLLTFYTVNRSGMISKGELKIFYMTDYQRLDAEIAALMQRTNMLCVAFALMAILISALISALIARPMRLLSAHMARYRVGGEPVMLGAGRRDEIGEIYTAYYNMSAQIRDLFERLQMEQVTKEKYYYESLRSRMSPHFLFNTLNTIRWMAMIRGADNIRESIDALAGILTYSLDAEGEMVLLSQELDVVSAYCLIQNIRFGNACKLILDVPEAVRGLSIVKFILQPAVENCFKYAVGQGRAGGVIRVAARTSGSELIIRVEDDGGGFSEESLRAFEARRDRGNVAASSSKGIGLRIVDERIRVAFGDGYGIELRNDDGAQVWYRLPVIRREGDAP